MFQGLMSSERRGTCVGELILGMLGSSSAFSKSRPLSMPSAHAFAVMNSAGSMTLMTTPHHTTPYGLIAEMASGSHFQAWSDRLLSQFHVQCSLGA